MLNFTFHGIGEPPGAVGAAERDVWVSAAEFHDALAAIDALDAATVSFDDGNASDLEVALPTLLDRGLTATFFVVADRLGAPGYLGAADLLALREAGMAIGLHGRSHRPWRGLADADLDDEIIGARETLEAALGAPVSEAACPFGAYDRRVLGRLRRAGYTRVFTSDGGRAAPGAWLQARNTLRAGTDAAAVARIAAAGGPARHTVRRAKTLAKSLR